MLQQVEVPLVEIAGLLRRDPALTARLIAIANSAAYARAEPATSLEEAVACVGYREVYRLVGAVVTSQLVDEPLRSYGLDPIRFRENALFVALVMEQLAEATGGEPRVAYTVGLLRSCGKVALDRFAAEHRLRISPLGDGALLDWERTNWGTTNATIGAQLLEAWRFPSGTVEAVRCHYTPASGSSGTAHLLNLAAGAAELRGFGFEGEGGYWQFAPESFARIGLDEGALVWAGERAFQLLTRISGVLA